MQPQRTNSPNSQYDFIINSGQSAKKKRLPDLGLSPVVKLILEILLGALILVILLAILTNLKRNNGASLSQIVGQAQEYSRVSQIAVEDAADPDTKALASTVSYVMESQQKGFNSYVASSGQKLNPSVLASLKNSTTDQAFTAAVQNNDFDSTYINYLRSNLDLYQLTLKNAYDGTKNQSLKNILNDDYQSVQTLLTTSPLKL